MSTLSPPFIIRRLLLNLEQYIPDIQTKKNTEHLLLLHYQLLNFKNKKINKKLSLIIPKPTMDITEKFTIKQILLLQELKNSGLNNQQIV